MGEYQIPKGVAYPRPSLTRWQRLRVWLTPHYGGEYAGVAPGDFGAPGCDIDACHPECSKLKLLRRYELPKARVVNHDC